jgi:hypothetical protein
VNNIPGLLIRIRIEFGRLDPDPDAGGRKWPTKKIKCWEMFRFQVLDVLFWGLKASPVTLTSFKEAWGQILRFFFNKNYYFFNCNFFLQFLVIKSLDHWPKMLDLDPDWDWKQCGSIPEHCNIQDCYFCHPSDSTVSEAAGIEPRTVSHCNENPIYVFLFWVLRGLSPNFHIYVSMSDLYIPRIGPHIFL